MKGYKYFCLLPALLIIFSSCRETAGKIALGEWKYRLFVNGVDVGNAVISSKMTDGNFVSSSVYNMKLADMTTETRDIVTETTDFRPLRLESSTKILNGKESYNTHIVSVFNGKDVELTHGGKKFNYTINRDFIIDGVYFMDQLVRAKFRKGFEVTNYVYNPSVELETPIKATTKVIGYEKVMINGKEKELCHIVQSIENIKDNIDLYIDEGCVMQKGIIRMLNLKIELILI